MLPLLRATPWSLFVLTILGSGLLGQRAAVAADLSDYQWSVVDPAADWAPRAGLQVIDLNQQFFLMGGRTPIDPAVLPVFGASDIWADVWRSDDQGDSWELILATDAAGHWPARAYFQAVTKDNEMYVLGGQNFSVIDNPDPTGPPQISVSDFFNDVWSSTDGITWSPKTMDAGWEGRAGLSSVVFRDELYVFGGSTNDDSAIVGPGGPPRIYFNDVWKSSNDGVDWQQVSDAAPWEPRAGAAVVVKDDYIYLLGGEDGFHLRVGVALPTIFQRRLAHTRWNHLGRGGRCSRLAGKARSPGCRRG